MEDTLYIQINNVMKEIIYHFTEVNMSMFKYCYTYNIPFEFDGEWKVTFHLSKEFVKEFTGRFKTSSWT